MSMTPNEHPATAVCPQCGHEAEAELLVNQDGSGAYVHGRRCLKCGGSAAMAIRFVLPGADRWNALRAWLTGERIAVEARMRRIEPEGASFMRLRGRLDETVMALQRMDDLQKTCPTQPETQGRAKP